MSFECTTSHSTLLTQGSKILLVVLASGEAFVVDSRAPRHSRTELCETIDESDEAAQRFASFALPRCKPSHWSHKICYHDS